MTDTKTTDRTKYSSAVYAVAGLGDLFVTQLRKLPAVTEKLQGKAAEWRSATGVQAPQWKQKAADYSVLASDKAAELTGKATDQATKLYDELVTRGERAFGTEQPAATTEVPAAAPAKKSAAKQAAPKKAAKRAPSSKAE